jgi:hypothetical protein
MKMASSYIRTMVALANRSWKPDTNPALASISVHAKTQAPLEAQKLLHPTSDCSTSKKSSHVETSAPADLHGARILLAAATDLLPCGFEF